MRLSDALSKSLTTDFGTNRRIFEQQKIKRLKFQEVNSWKSCFEFLLQIIVMIKRTFFLEKNCFVLRQSKTASIDCVLECPRCGASVQMWFLLNVEMKMIYITPYPYIRSCQTKL